MNKVEYAVHPRVAAADKVRPRHRTLGRQAGAQLLHMPRPHQPLEMLHPPPFDELPQQTRVQPVDRQHHHLPPTDTGHPTPPTSAEQPSHSRTSRQTRPARPHQSQEITSPHKLLPSCPLYIYKYTIFEPILAAQPVPLAVRRVPLRLVLQCFRRY